MVGARTLANWTRTLQIGVFGGTWDTKLDLVQSSKSFLKFSLPEHTTTEMISHQEESDPLVLVLYS